MEFPIYFLYSVLYLLAFVIIPIFAANYDGQMAMKLKEMDMEYGEKLSSLSEEELPHLPTAIVKDLGLNLGPIREVDAADRFHENMAWLHPNKTLHHRRVLRSASSMETSGRLFHLNPTREPPKLAKYARKAKNKIKLKRALYIDYDSDYNEDSESNEESLHHDLTFTPSTTTSYDHKGTKEILPSHPSKKRRKPTRPVTRRPTAHYDDYTPTYESPKTAYSYGAKSYPRYKVSGHGAKSMSPFPSTKKRKKPSKNTPTCETTCRSTTIACPEKEPERPKPSKETTKYSPSNTTRTVKKRPSAIANFQPTSKMFNTEKLSGKVVTAIAGSQQTSTPSNEESTRTVTRRPTAEYDDYMLTYESSYGGKSMFPSTRKRKKPSKNTQTCGTIYPSTTIAYPDTIRTVKKRPSAIAYFQPTSKMYNTIKEWSGKKKLSDKVVTVAGLQRPVDSTSRARCTTSKPLPTLNPDFVPSSSEMENNKPQLPLDEDEKNRKPNKYRAPDIHVPPNNYIDDEK